uniref:Uncharacterized protein n=1 Tax=Anopheles arabiensis TaxID=7173 RepID=A0A2C9GPB0_ANOAR
MDCASSGNGRSGRNRGHAHRSDPARRTNTA